MRHNIWIPLEIWEPARKKAGLTSLSAIIRRLLELWMNGEIEL